MGSKASTTGDKPVLIPSISFPFTASSTSRYLSIALSTISDTLGLTCCTASRAAFQPAATIGPTVRLIA